jgi:hypothetical protein
MLFKTTAQIQDFFPVDKDFAYNRLKPFIQDAEDAYIVKVIGAAQLAALQAAFDANTLSSQQTNLLTAIRKPLIKLTFYAAAPTIKLRWNDGGIQKLESADYSNAEGGDVYFARVQHLIDGYRGLDALYKFLFDNKADYPLWTADASYTQFTTYFVNTSEKFGTHVAACKNRWLYAQLVPEMDIIEQLRIKGALGETFFNTLKTRFAAGTLTSDETTLVNKLSKVIALFTYAKVLTDPTIRETLRIANAASAEDLSNKGTATADYRAEYAALAAQKQEEAAALMEQVVRYLNATATASIFADWYTGDFYVAPTDTDPHTQQYNNDISESSFAIL